jgi:uncharacterized protein (DUF2141 family)
VGVLLGNGDGTFRPMVTYDSGDNSIHAISKAYAVVVADVNKDGKLDLVVANSYDLLDVSYGGTVGVLLGNGDGTFQTAEAYSSGDYDSNSIAVGDLNGDGNLDLVVANHLVIDSSGTTVGVLLGNGDGTFQPVVTYSAGEYILAVVAADVNGDDKLDLVVAIYGGVGVLLGNGDGSFRPMVTYSSGGRFTFSVAVGDVNGDGRLDLLLGNDVTSMAMLLGNGDGTFRQAVAYSSGGSNYALSVAVGDLNGDGRLDIVADTGLESVGVLINQSAPVGSVSPTSLAFGNQTVNTTSATKRISLSNTGNYQVL